jgi:hypothetical protein
MPNKEWSALNNLQLGRYAQYFAKMEFSSYGLEVYASEVDDHGIDFIVKDKGGRFCEIQVKVETEKGYIFIQKDKFDIDNRNLYLTLLVFKSGELPDIFLIPAETGKSLMGYLLIGNTINRDKRVYRDTELIYHRKTTIDLKHLDLGKTLRNLFNEYCI